MSESVPVRKLEPGVSGLGDPDAAPGAEQFRRAGRRGALAKAAAAETARRVSQATDGTTTVLRKGGAIVAREGIRLAPDVPKRRGRPPGAKAAAAPEKGKRSCGSCGERGHSKRTCPAAQRASSAQAPAQGVRAARVEGEVAIHPGAMSALAAAGVTMDVVTCRCGRRHRVLTVFDPCVLPR